MDGFPAEQPEVEKFLYDNFVYKKRFPTYLFIDRLVRKGARLVGTESPELLREECQYVQEVTRVIVTNPDMSLPQKKAKANSFFCMSFSEIHELLKDFKFGLVLLRSLRRR